MTSCLFVIDVQNGFINHNSNHVVGRILNLLECNLFDHVVFTRFKNAKDSPFVRNLKWHRFFDTHEIDIVEQLKNLSENIFDKSIYSSINQEAKQFLARNNISKVFLCGIDTECCVLATAIDLFQINIHPIVLAHYCASKAGQDVHQAGLTVLKRMIGSSNIVEQPIDSLNFPNLLATE